MKSNISRKYYTVKRSDTCISGYGIYECEGDRCKLVACITPQAMTTLDLDFYTKIQLR